MICNTIYRKRPEHLVTYKSGNRSSQLVFILYRKRGQVEMQNCKVIPGDHVTGQHRLVILDVNVKLSQKQTCRWTTENNIKWFKLVNIETRTKSKERALQELKQEIGVDDDVEEWWNQTNATKLKMGKEILGESNGKIMENKEIWWFNEEVQQKTMRKKEAKKRYVQTEDDIDKGAYKQCKKEAKKAVAIAKAEASEEIYKELDTRSGQEKIFRLAKQRQSSTRDITHIQQIKDENGNVLRKETKIVKR